MHKTTALGLLLLASCAPNYDDDASLRDISAQAVVYDGPQTVITGRHVVRDDGAAVLSWAGSSVRTRFRGPSIDVRLKKLEGQKQNFFQVILDGNDAQVLAVDGGQSSYTINAQGDGPHDLQLVKLNEPMDGIYSFGGFTPASGGALLPTPRPTGRRLLFIGDSITCGYGNKGVIETIMLTENPQSPHNNLRDCNYFLGKKVYEVSSAYEAYGTQTARRLNAEWQLISWSGKGIYRNADGTTAETLPDIWQRAVANDGNTRFEATDYVPQAVVINLGTNDFGSVANSDKPGGGAPNLPLFRSRYVTLIKQVRAAFPSAWIFVATGPMLSDYYPDNFKALTAMRIATKEILSTLGDGRVRTLEFPLNVGSETDATGCEWHPSAAQDGNMATKLLVPLKKALEWK